MSEFAPKKKRLPKLPGDKQGWREVALRYLERFEAPAERVRKVLKDRARLHNALNPDVEHMIDDVVGTLQHARIIDDARYAEMRAQSLARRGKGNRLIKQDLAARGVASPIADTAIEEGEWTERQAAITFARRKRLGPFRTGRALEAWTQERDKQRQKEMAALLRAGHSMDNAHYIVHAEDEAALLSWACD